jgi:hypothetical protein
MTEMPTADDFAAAAARAEGRDLDALYAEAGLSPGPARWMLSVGTTRLPLRLFAALALRQAGSDANPGTEEARKLAETAGLRPYDGHLAEGPLRTG